MENPGRWPTWPTSKTLTHISRLVWFSSDNENNILISGYIQTINLWLFIYVEADWNLSGALSLCIIGIDVSLYFLCHIKQVEVLVKGSSHWYYPYNGLQFGNPDSKFSNLTVYDYHKSYFNNYKYHYTYQRFYDQWTPWLYLYRIKHSENLLQKCGRNWERHSANLKTIVVVYVCLYNGDVGALLTIP